mgnify:CR=1 FL=1
MAKLKGVFSEAGGNPLGLLQLLMIRLPCSAITPAIAPAVAFLVDVKGIELCFLNCVKLFLMLFEEAVDYILSAFLRNGVVLLENSSSDS